MFDTSNFFNLLLYNTISIFLLLDIDCNLYSICFCNSSWLRIHNLLDSFGRSSGRGSGSGDCPVSELRLSCINFIRRNLPFRYNIVILNNLDLFQPYLALGYWFRDLNLFSAQSEFDYLDAIVDVTTSIGHQYDTYYDMHICCKEL